MENVVDPSHFPWSHHGTFFGTRDMAKPLNMRLTEPVFSTSLAAVEYQPAKGTERSRAEIVTPSNVWLQDGTFGEGQNWTQTVLFASPVDDRTCRSFILGFLSTSFHEPSKNPLKYVPWMLHWINMGIFDGDNVFLHGQDQHLRSMKKTWSPDMYYMATSADLLVSTYRKWLQTKGGGGPMKKMSEPNSVTRRELLDRYTSHTSQCKPCQRGLKLLNTIANVCKILSRCCLFFAVSLFANSLTGRLAHWKAALPLIPLCLFVFIEKQIRDKFIPQFYFVDYIHAEKN